MKFLYPIKKLNIKPWIKYWILKKGLNPVVLSELIEGTSPITIEKAYEGTTLQELAFKGQTLQEGTPSPEAPISVQVVKEDNYININEESYRVDLGGKNKFNYQYSQLRNINRVTISEETNGFKLTSTGVAGYGFASLPIDNNLLGKQVTISCNSSGNKTPSARLFYHNSSGSLASNIGAFWTTNTAHTVTLPSTLPSGATGIDIVFYISQGNNAEGDYVTFTNIQIETGTVATEYSPYTDNPIELCKIGNYQDKLYYDSGKWYLLKNIKKLNLTDYKDVAWWKSGKTVKATWSFLDIDDILPSTSNNTPGIMMSSHFKNTYVNDIYNGTSLIGCAVGTDGLYFSNNEWTVNDFKTYITNNTVYVYCALSTPTTTEITDTTLISQLEAIKNATLISGTNEITQLPSDLPFILNFKYYMKG